MCVIDEPLIYSLCLVFSFNCLHVQNFASFFQNKSKNHTKCLTYLLQNEALHSKYHKRISKANTFAIILIPVRFVCYVEN